MSNLDIWNELGRTDPAHTKQFQRAGGFKGTAIKPIYTEMKMTETFGPCGIGWGYSDPTFQLVNGPEGEVAVYCWLTLWYRRSAVDKISGSIPGVGGDFVVKKNKFGLSVDDEAFKKAATDAQGNAMKHLGMSADVHMGRFDDSKYVEEMKQEARRSSNSEKKKTDARGDTTWEQFQHDLSECETALRVEKMRKYYQINIYPTWPGAWPATAEQEFENKLASFSAGEDLEQTLRDSVDTETGEITPGADGLRDELVERIEAMDNAEDLLRLRDRADFKSALARLPEPMQVTVRRHGAAKLKALPAGAS